MAGASTFPWSSFSTLNNSTGATFGASFGNAFGGGTKLSSFAAPVGDAQWGSSGGNTRLFGAPAKDEEEGKSDSEAEGVVDTVKEQEGVEVSDMFQQQDSKCGKTSSFDYVMSKRNQSQLEKMAKSLYSHHLALTYIFGLERHGKKEEREPLSSTCLPQKPTMYGGFRKPVDSL